MRVRVKEGKSGFYGTKRRTEGEEFTLVPVTGITTFRGRPEKVVMSPEDQFSENWMERLDGEFVAPDGKEEVEGVEGIDGPSLADLVDEDEATPIGAAESIS